MFIIECKGTLGGTFRGEFSTIERAKDYLRLIGREEEIPNIEEEEAA